LNTFVAIDRELVLHSVFISSVKYNYLLWIRNNILRNH